MNITFEPLQDKGKTQIARVFINGTYAFNEWASFPNPFDFKSTIQIRYLLDLYNTTLNDLRLIMDSFLIKESEYELMASQYGPGWWVWMKDLDQAIKIWQYFRVDK